MVNQSHRISGSAAGPTGLRPLNPFRDLGDVARVIEVAFADELEPTGYGITRELRQWNSLRPILRALSLVIPSLREMLLGFVWEENGRVIGNISLTRADSGGRQWIISNVSVLPEFRRRGIAIALMDAALEFVRSRGGERARLHVHESNVAAQQLYLGLGFRQIESVAELIAPRVTVTHLPVEAGVEIRAPQAERWQEAYEVARAAIPAAVQQIRPLRPHTFRHPPQDWFEQLRRRIAGQPRERWWAEVDGRVGALLTIEHRAGPAERQVELLIPPMLAGRVEGALVNRLSSRLSGRRQVRATLDSRLTIARDALQHAGFRPYRTLDHMVLEVDG